jgi:hypothetical protein
MSVAQAQYNYPLEGNPQGGDRRGTYYDAQGRPNDKMVPLFKDPKIYLDNMTLVAHLPASQGGPQMMTIGDQRYIIGRGTVTDVTDPRHPLVINNRAPRGQVAYNQAMGKWIVMQPVAFPVASQPYLQASDRLPHPQTDQGRFLGVIFFDITDPRKPVEISRFRVPGRGVHPDGVYYDGGRYAYLASATTGSRPPLPFHMYSHVLQVVDVSDMANPKEVSKWWVPGQMIGEDKEYEAWPENKKQAPQKVWNKDLRYRYSELHGPCFVPNRIEDGGTRGYCGWSQFGLIILDFSDIAHPKMVGQLDISPPFDGGIPVHTAMPMLDRKLVFINGEPLYQDCGENLVPPFIVDIRAESHPVAIATFPLPKPPAGAPYNDFCFRAYRFGTHDAIDIKAPGEPRVDLFGLTWFSAGFRLYDIANPFQPREVASVVPKQGEERGTEFALIEWDRNLVHVFADSGHYILSTPMLGEPVLGPLKPKRWSLPGLNVGAP